MTSIADFVHHRWEDAKEALRKLDPEFVSRLESEYRLQGLGLIMPQQYSTGRKPKQPLSSKWHHLLEACVELTMQVGMVQVAATALTAEENVGLASCEAGMRDDYHVRSWSIHAVTLAERTDSVIRQTSNVYIAETERRMEVGKLHSTNVYQKITKRIDKQRNEYVHPRRSWARGITEDQLWEGQVVIGMTPRRLLNEFYYPVQGDNMMLGKHDIFVGETNRILDCIGAILQEFEADLTSRSITP